jgi:hypothetical protein
LLNGINGIGSMQNIAIINSWNEWICSPFHVVCFFIVHIAELLCRENFQFIQFRMHCKFKLATLPVFAKVAASYI